LSIEKAEKPGKTGFSEVTGFTVVSVFPAFNLTG